MIGYQNPNQGNDRRKQLAQFLKGQSQTRAQSANRMRGLNTSAMGTRSPGAGNPFFKGSSKASPEKFAFANQKPSLKTLLGLVGKTMGSGGYAGMNFFSPDLPVGGIEWGGDVGPPQTQTPTVGGLLNPNDFDTGTGPNLGDDFRTIRSQPPTQNGLPTYYPSQYGEADAWARGLGGFRGSAPGVNPILGDLIYGLL